MKRCLVILAVLLTYIMPMSSQEVVVSVTPVQQVLPPQALMFVANPGRFFNVTVTNLSSQSQQVYLSMQISSVSPKMSNMLATPHDRQPQQPIAVPANSTIHLNMVEMKRLFSHISHRDIRCEAGIQNGYMKGSYGLFPEGRYMVQFTAYRWNLPQLSSPVVLSNPNNGKSFFQVAYKACAPEFLTPVVNKALSASAVELDPMDVRFTWKESVVTSYPNGLRYYYKLKIVEVMEGQPIDYAMTHNPVVFQSRNLLAPLCNIPVNYVRNRFTPGKMYAAQVIATARIRNGLEYALVDNDGRSDIKLFSIIPQVTKMTEPADTLFDKELWDSVQDILEEDSVDSSVEEYAMEVEDCMLSAMEAWEKLNELDSVAILKLNSIRQSVTEMKRVSYAAAKKAGHTAVVRDSYKELSDILSLAKEEMILAKVEYAYSYRSLKNLEASRKDINDSLERKDSRLIYAECVNAVIEARKYALKAGILYQSILHTRQLADKEFKYLEK